MSAAVKASCGALALVVGGACVIETPVEEPAPRPRPLVLVVSPAVATVEAGSELQFVATVTGTGPVPQVVRWSLYRETPAYVAGEIDQSGTYRVAGPPDIDVREHVIATSTVDPSVSAEAIVDIPQMSVTIEPANPRVMLGDTLQFSATVRGLASKAVTSWRCDYGTIDENGLYSAPTLPLNGRDWINVQAAAAPPASGGTGSATIHLIPRPPVLTATSGPIVPSTQLTVFGSDFLSSYSQVDVMFETAGGLWLRVSPTSVFLDHLTVMPPTGDALSGRLLVRAWVPWPNAYGGYNPLDPADSNIIVAR